MSEHRFALASTAERSPAPKRACIEQLEKLDFSPVKMSEERRAQREGPSKKALPDGPSASVALNGGRSARRESLSTSSAATSLVQSAAAGAHEEHDENWILAEVVSHELLEGRVIYTIFDIDSEDADGYISLNHYINAFIFIAILYSLW